MKVIESAKDLAINGALPAFEQPLHVGQPHVADRELFYKYLDKILDRCWLTNNGPVVQKLEQQLADTLQVKYCVAMSSGTLAMELAIRALGLTGEVIIPSYTFIATAHTLQWQGITPVFADIDPDSQTLSPTAVRRAISPQTTGITAVHLWGRPAYVEELQAIADEYNLQLLFDAAHAFGCSHNSQMIGGFGACEVFSFHATKIFNTFEGGAVTTNNTKLAKALRLMRNFGFSGMDSVVMAGTNGKMSEVAAAMGLVNLESFDQLLTVNRHNYEMYKKSFAAVPGVCLMEYDKKERNNYQYVVISIDDEFPASRDQVIRALQAENILARRYFWPGCHNMQPYCKLYPEAGLRLPNTKKAADRVVVLPTGNQMDEEKIRFIVRLLKVLAVCS